MRTEPTTPTPAAGNADGALPVPFGLERAGPGHAVTAFDRGDFVLVAGSHFNSRLIRFGQRLHSSGVDRCYSRWTHAALIANRDGTLIEAVGRGVRQSHLDAYRHEEYVVVHLHISAEDRDQVVEFAEWALEHKARYSRLQTVSMGLALLTGSRLTFFIDGQFVCSGLVARALERTANIFDRDPTHMAPAHLASYFLSGRADAIFNECDPDERGGQDTA